YVIFRPGPYICAEWEFGGLPAWLLKDGNIKLRCSHADYLEAVERFMTEMLRRIAPLQVTRGGNVIMIQVENEYGAYGNDKAYLEKISALYKNCGIDIPYFTSDQPHPHMLKAGSVDGALVTGNFGSNAKVRFPRLRAFQPKGPLMNAEFWCGWFDHWGGPHHTRSAKSAAASFDEALSLGGSVNFYMFHGGTNFGFMNGANCKGPRQYTPTVTSYDYDALLSESGDITEKYLACRRVLGKYQPLPAMPAFDDRKLSVKKIEFTGCAALPENLAALSDKITSPHTLTMEQSGQNWGFILYRTKVQGPAAKGKLNILDIMDRAVVMVNGCYQGTLYRNDKSAVLEISIPQGEATLDILVENMGRTNYGPYMTEPKGITMGVQLNEQYLFGWEIYPLPLEKLDGLAWQPLSAARGGIPAFYRAEFDVQAPADTFLNISSWGKGIAFVNGFNLGRYWEIGPQKTLYIPGPVLKKGKNEIVLFDLHKNGRAVSLDKKP
ncbi:MAG: beta-galactosidase, partial [Spirochaetota bacterium]